MLTPLFLRTSLLAVYLQAYARDHTELVGVKKGSWGHTAAFEAAWNKMESEVRHILQHVFLYLST
jgi:hypothetical protein